eukprot:15155304-Alexandrium_andersonii.AAC.1
MSLRRARDASKPMPHANIHVESAAEADAGPLISAQPETTTVAGARRSAPEWAGRARPRGRPR